MVGSASRVVRDSQRRLESDLQPVPVSAFSPAASFSSEVWRSTVLPGRRMKSPTRIAEQRCSVKVARLLF